MSIWSDIQDRSSGEQVRKEDLMDNLIKVEWDVSATCKEYCTAWITYTVGNESIRKRARLYSSQYRHLWVENKDFWAVLRFMIGGTLEKERKCGIITMNRWKTIIKNTDHFHSDCWDERLHDFAWQNHYCSNSRNWINDFMDKVGDEYEEGSGLVGYL